MKVLIAETPATHVMVTNMNNMTVTYIPLENWDEIKPMLSENSVYQDVNINKDGVVLNLGGITNEANRATIL